MKPWKAIVAALVIFLAGMVSGGLATQLYRGQPQKPALAPGGPLSPWTAQRIEFLRRVGNKLDLTPQQREQLDKRLHESQQRMKKLWEPVAPQAQEEMKQLRRRIEAELTPAQREKFEKLLKERPPHPSGEPGWRRREGRPAGTPPRRPSPEGPPGGPPRPDMPPPPK